MKPADDRCEEHGLYLYRTGFGWSCKLGCYYCEDPQKIKERFIKQYKEELKDKINIFMNILEDELLKMQNNSYDKTKVTRYMDIKKKEILELLKND